MRPIFLAAALAALAFAAVPAAAVDDVKPVPCNGTFLYTDAKADADGGTQAPAAQLNGNTEILAGFLKHDPAKAAEATTLNLVVKDMKVEVPSGYTTNTWVQYWAGEDKVERFVRAVIDFGGGSAFEYGRFQPNPAEEGVTGVSIVEGTTPGKFFAGPEGVIQLVVPAALAKSGDKWENMYARATQGRSAPATVPGQVRGITTVVDTAPNTEEAGTPAPVKGTVAPCVSDGSTPPPATGGGSTGGGSTGGGSTGGGSTGGGSTGGGSTGGTPPQSKNTTLPVQVLTKSVKAKQAKKKLKLKLKSSEKVTNLAAQLRKGRKVVGTGKLASMNGPATLLLKVKNLKRGSYVLDLAGNDAAGKRLLTTVKLAVK